MKKLLLSLLLRAKEALLEVAALFRIGPCDLCKKYALLITLDDVKGVERLCTSCFKGDK